MFVEILRQFRKRFRRKLPKYLDQDNTPIHNSFLVTVYLTKMGFKTCSSILALSVLVEGKMKGVVTKVLNTFISRASMGPLRSGWSVTSALDSERPILEQIKIFTSRKLLNASCDKVSEASKMRLLCSYIFVHI